ncbi:AAA family ATPase [Alkaliflexus imshenetskii]|uniref:AAA family ATPase n=1 Tax=Alkaliflexus imshenetskii TaxID=286730 RepID=UPI00047C2B86|nr:AAA family ATPase [Alkaliflexus imshenetskii]
MRIDKVNIKDFKNLQDFKIDLDEREMKTVLLGQNATGKSNFFEALILIFKHLDLSTDKKRVYPSFNYSIEYQIGRNKIHTVKIDYKDQNYNIKVDDEKIESLKSFFSDEGKTIYQPKYVFTYYSGLSNKLKELFWDHQKNFYDKIIKPDFSEDNLESLRKLFYVQLVHSYFVLLAYFSFEKEEKESIDFLSNVLNILDIESVLFVLKMPDWAKNRIKDNPDDIFWTADGLVRKFLELLWDNSLAPIYNSERKRIDFDDYEAQDRLYLYIKTKACLQKISCYYSGNTEFFKALESTYISKMIEEVRIKVKKKDVKDGVVFKELSEGEQQLLTVLGLLKFTKDEDSLILLDEPDTHLNPVWKWKYLEYLERVVDRPESTQIIINTHDPLVIGNLRKEEVRIFRNENGKTITEEPDIDPRGLGVEGILTSELFGLPTIIDSYTNSILEKRNELLVKQEKQKLNEDERNKLNSLFNELEKLGISKTFRDPMYQRFIIAFKEKNKIPNKDSYSKDELKQQNELALKILKDLEKEDAK